jgi:hypothetical protein
MTDSYQVANWQLIDAASMMQPHLRIVSFFGAILVAFFFIIKLYSSVPIRLIVSPVVVSDDPLFRRWTQEWESLTYRVRAILDGDVYDNIDDNRISVHTLQ